MFPTRLLVRTAIGLGDVGESVGLFARIRHGVKDYDLCDCSPKPLKGLFQLLKFKIQRIL